MAIFHVSTKQSGVEGNNKPVNQWQTSPAPRIQRLQLQHRSTFWEMTHLSIMAAWRSKKNKPKQNTQAPETTPPTDTKLITKCWQSNIRLSPNVLVKVQREVNILPGVRQFRLRCSKCADTFFLPPPWVSQLQCQPRKNLFCVRFLVSRLVC